MEDDVENNSGTDNYQRQILANNKEKSFSNEHEMQHRHHHHRYRHHYHIHISSMTPNATIMDPLRASLHALSHDQLLISSILSSNNETLLKHEDPVPPPLPPSYYSGLFFQ